MKNLVLALLLGLSTAAHAQNVWFYGSGEAVNLTNGIAYKNGVRVIAGPLDPSATAVNAPSGSLYISSSGTTYVKQDAGLSTNWLPFGIAAAGSLTTLNGQSGPAVNIATGATGTDFNISAAANTISLNIPSSSAANRGLLTAADYSTFLAKQDAITGGATTIVSADLTADRALISNGSGKVAVSPTSATELSYVDGVTSAIQTQIDGKEPSITAATTADYWRGDKSFQPLDKTAVGLPNVDNTSDADKPVSTATQTALDAKITGPASSVDGEVVLFDSTTGKLAKRATGTGYAKVTSGVLSTSATVPIADLTGVLPMANGGTDKALTPVLGGVIYTDAGSMEVLSPGTAGQILQTNGAAAPTFVNKSISGKAQSLSAVTLEEIQVPNNQLTQTAAGKFLNETGNQNILVDPSLEGANNSSAWVFSGGTLTIDNTPIHGVFNGLVEGSANSIEMTQSSTLYSTEFADGVQGLASMRVRLPSTVTTPLYVCSIKAGTVGAVGTGCVQVQANGKWGLYKVPFILGGTSNGIALTSKGVILGDDVEWDDAFVGAVDLKQDVNNVGAWTNGTCVSSWTTNTTTTCKYRQVGDSIEVLHQMSFAGAPNATALIVTIPSGFTIDTSKLTGTNTGTPLSTSGSLLDAGVQGYMLFAKYGSTTTLNISYGVSGTDASTVTATAPFTVGNLDFGWVNYKVPVTQFSNATSTYSSTCGANCVDTFSAEVSSTGVVSGEEVDWISGNCTNVTSPVCTFNSNIFTVAPNCWSSPMGTGSDGGGSSTSTTFTSYLYNSSFTLIAGARKIFCKKTGADFVATRTIIGSFNEVVTVPGVTKPTIYSATIGSACAVTDEFGGDWINGNGVYTATGICTTQFSSAFSPVKCWCDANNSNGNSGGCFTTISSSTTQVVTQALAGSATPTALGVDVFCLGSKP